jgi:hypothetical protein
MSKMSKAWKIIKGIVLGMFFILVACFFVVIVTAICGVY